MGQPSHRFHVTLAAAVLLPVSTVLVSTTSTPAAPTLATSAATVPTPTVRNPAAPAGQHAGGADTQTVPAGTKIAPPGYGRQPGKATVITQTVAQRVAAASTIGSLDLPGVALAAYRHAAQSVDGSDPGCHLGWSVLAAIGQVESDQGRYGGSVVLANGEVTPVILGPVLDGTGHMAGISDTDNGRYDGDTRWDRAVGPMQFIPGTWAVAGADGNGDGVRDPSNFFDAALAAARYLCAGSTNFSSPASAQAAILRYNHSAAYVDVVLRLARAYAHGDIAVVDGGSGYGSGTTTAVGVRPHAPHGPPTHQPPTQPPHQAAPHRPSHRPQHHKPPQHQPPGHKPPHHQPPHHQPPHHQPPALPVLQPCDNGWCLGKDPLNLGTNPDLSVVEGDYNLDGTAASVQDELTSMAGLEVKVTVGSDAQPDSSGGDQATTTTGATPQHALRKVHITLDADGLVLTINGLPYVPHPLIAPGSPSTTTSAGTAGN